MSSPQEVATNYLHKHNLEKLFALLGAKIAYAKPDDINDFLIRELIEIQANRSAGKKYSLFTPSDIDAMFAAFDITGKGYLTPKQYRTALLAVGIVEPKHAVPNTEKIDRNTFSVLMKGEVADDAF